MSARPKKRHNPRQVRLAIEYTNLVNLASRSDFIHVEPLDVRPGWPPEKYLITYTCRGIVGVAEGDEPVYGEFHQVKMYLPSDYPLREPYLKWLTPIWHPNIEHEEPHHVCTNAAQNYYAGKPLSDLVRAMGEMVRYERYHAVWAPPYPLDRAAAAWVVEHAELRGIVSKTKPVDERPLLRPQRSRLWGGGTPSRRIALGQERRAATANRVEPHPGTRKLTTGRLVELSAAILGRRVTRALEVIGLRTAAGRECAGCERPLRGDARFCPYCGTAAGPAPPACGSCQTSIPSFDSRFCPRCGVPVAALAIHEKEVRHD
jgi:ubiquitin-protein ligase